MDLSASFDTTNQQLLPPQPPAAVYWHGRFSLHGSGSHTSDRSHCISIHHCRSHTNPGPPWCTPWLGAWPAVLPPSHHTSYATSLLQTQLKIIQNTLVPSPSSQKFLLNRMQYSTQTVTMWQLPSRVPNTVVTFYPALPSASTSSSSLLL